VSVTVRLKPDPTHEESLRAARSLRRDAFTNVITDAYSVSGDTLTVERQLSVVVQPAEVKDGRVDRAPGRMATLEVPANNRQTIVYRRR